MRCDGRIRSARWWWTAATASREARSRRCRRGRRSRLSSTGFATISCCPATGRWSTARQMLIKDMNVYTAAKVCANMFHAGADAASPIFPPYQIFDRGGIRGRLRRLQRSAHADPAVSAYSRGITFTRPERDLASYVSVLRREKGCHLVFVLSHMGLAQQLNLANQPCADGVDYILGADTHERVREPLQGQVLQGHRTGRLRVVRRQARPGRRERQDQGADATRCSTSTRNGMPKIGR